MFTISALIPTYNRAHLVGEAIESALRQTRRPDEILVVDDGSTDDTERVLARYHGTVRILRQENAGPSAARNRGIQAASGDFVALLDSDDVWVEDRIERQESLLAFHPDVDVVFGLDGKFTAGREHEPWEPNNPPLTARLDPDGVRITDAFGMLLDDNFFINTSTVLFRKACVVKAGLMNPGMRLCEDYDLWLRFALHGFRFAFVNATLCGRRIHEGNLIKERLAMNAAAAETLSRYRGCSPGHAARLDAKLSSIHYDLGSAFLKLGNWEAAYKHLKGVHPRYGKGMKWRFKMYVASFLRNRR